LSTSVQLMIAWRSDIVRYWASGIFLMSGTEWLRSISRVSSFVLAISGCRGTHHARPRLPP
jgi:hypothetical protein